MKRTFCTIITHDYLHYALALNSSLLKYDGEIELKIFIADRDGYGDELLGFDNIELIHIRDLCSTGIGLAVQNKYKNTNVSYFRWSMKSVLIRYLLNTYDEVFYVDSDLFFYSSYEFLYKELYNNSIILTPHWRSSNPYLDAGNFATLQTSGLFNAGFIGVSEKGKDAMDWWATVCEYNCEISPDKGLFADQAYLDLMYIYFEGVQVIRHKGCNIANWNQVECKREVTNDGLVKINNKESIVFIHFTQSTINGIMRGDDEVLLPFYTEYSESLEYYKRITTDNNLP